MMNTTEVYINWRAIIQLCDRVNAERDGDVQKIVQGLLKQLIRHFQSGNERQALQALATLEALVHRCGRWVEAEVGKFRFLNELIKLLSPTVASSILQYMAKQTPFAVRLELTDMLQRWQQSIGPREPKILQVNELLRSHQLQCLPPASKLSEKTQAKLHALNDETTAERLTELLKSGKRNDLQAANQLIQNILQEDKECETETTGGDSELDVICSSVKLLNEMLDSYDPTNDPSTHRFVVLEALNGTLEKAVARLFELASETDEKDTNALCQICSLIDEVRAVLQRYRLTVKRATTSGEPLSVERSPLSESVAESASASQTGAVAAELWSSFEKSGAGFEKDDTLLDLDVVVESVPPCAATAAAESDSPPAAVPRARLPSARPDTSFPIASNAIPPQLISTATGSSSSQVATADASLGPNAQFAIPASPPPPPSKLLKLQASSTTQSIEARHQNETSPPRGDIVDMNVAYSSGFSAAALVSGDVAADVAAESGFSGGSAETSADETALDLSAATSEPPEPVTANPPAPVDQQTIEVSGQSTANADVFDEAEERDEFIKQWREFGFSEATSNQSADRFIGKTGRYMYPIECATAYVLNRAATVDVPEFVIDSPDGSPDAISIANRIAAFGISEPYCTEYANRILAAANPFNRPLEDWLVAFFQDALSHPVSPPPGAKYGELYLLHNDSTRRSVYGFHQRYSRDILDPHNMRDFILQLLNSDKIRERVQEGQHFLFNGTDHERALTCVTKGIQQFDHSGACDFGGGFYVGRDLLSIVKHAASEYSEAPALLVYACTNDELLSEPFVGPQPGERLPTHVLDLYAKGEQWWQQCVKFYRNKCDFGGMDSELEKLLKSRELDFIRGPWNEGRKRDRSYYGFRADPSQQPDYPVDRLAVADYHPAGFTNNNEQIAINSAISKPSNRMDSFLVLAVFWEPNSAGH